MRRELLSETLTWTKKPGVCTKTVRIRNLKVWSPWSWAMATATTQNEHRDTGFNLEDGYGFMEFSCGVAEWSREYDRSRHPISEVTKRKVNYSRLSLHSLIWDFLLSQINMWTTTTWSNVWVFLPNPSSYEFLVGFLIWKRASNICILQHPSISVWFNPCSYTVYVTISKCRKNPKLTNIVIESKRENCWTQVSMREVVLWFMLSAARSIDSSLRTSHLPLVASGWCLQFSI